MEKKYIINDCNIEEIINNFLGYKNTNSIYESNNKYFLTKSQLKNIIHESILLEARTSGAKNKHISYDIYGSKNYYNYLKEIGITDNHYKTENEKGEYDCVFAKINLREGNSGAKNAFEELTKAKENISIDSDKYFSVKKIIIYDNSIFEIDFCEKGIGIYEKIYLFNFKGTLIVSSSVDIINAILYVNGLTLDHYIEKDEMNNIKDKIDINKDIDLFKDFLTPSLTKDDSIKTAVYKSIKNAILDAHEEDDDVIRNIDLGFGHLAKTNKEIKNIILSKKSSIDAINNGYSPSGKYEDKSYKSNSIYWIDKNGKIVSYNKERDDLARNYIKNPVNYKRKMYEHDKFFDKGTLGNTNPRINDSTTDTQLNDAEEHENKILGETGGKTSKRNVKNISIDGLYNISKNKINRSSATNESINYFIPNVSYISEAFIFIKQDD